LKTVMRPLDVKFRSSCYGDGMLSPWHLPIFVLFHFEIPTLS
jgi:hypothetical protein